VVAFIAGRALLSVPADTKDDKHDFSEFYCAAQIVAVGFGPGLYDIHLQSQFITRVAAIHAFYERPPFYTLIFLPFTFFSYKMALRLWMIISLGLLAAAAWLIEAHTKVTLAIAQYTRIPADFGLVLVLFVTFGPATTCLLLGQDSMLLLLVYTIVFLLLKRNSQFAGGCVLALGLFKFQFIVPFVLILLARRRWPAIAGFATVGGLLILVSTAISGLQSLRTYPSFLVFDSLNQQTAGFQPESMPNIRGIVYLLSNRWIEPSLSQIFVVVLSVCTLWFAAKRWQDAQFDFSFSAAILATLLTSYHLYKYDLTLLLLPVSVICGQLAQTKRLLASPSVLPAALVIILVHPLHSILVQQAIYAVMVVPVLLLFWTTVRLNETPQEKPIPDVVT
jgi:hypothetical protein